MKRLFFHIIFIFSLLFGQRLKAQEHPYFLQTHLNNQNGLPQNSIRDIVYSRSGFMWIATEDGLVCYNGKSTQVYNKDNSPLSSNRISQLLSSSNGKLYCICENRDLFEIIEKPPFIYFQYIEKAPEIGLNIYRLFAIDSLAQFKSIFKTVLAENKFNGEQASYFLIKEKKLIAQRSRDGFYIYSNEMKLLRKIVIKTAPKNNFFMQNGELYMFQPTGTFYLVNTITGQLEKLNYRPINKTQGNLIWNAKTEEVYWVSNGFVFDIKINHYQVELEKLITDLPAMDIENITRNKKNQDLVIGTSSNGFYIYRKQLFKIYHSNSSKDFFYAQSPAGDSNSVYSGNPLQIIGPKKNFKILKDEPYSYNLSSLYQDKNLNCWFTRRDSVFCLNHLSHQIVKSFALTALKNKSIFCLFEKNDSSFYISTPQSVFSFKIDSGLAKINDFPINIIQPYCMLKLSDSVVLVGTHVGIYKFNPSKGQLSYSCLSKRIVRALFKTSNGLVLAGTYSNGVFAIQNNTAIPIPIDKNDYLKSAHAFMEDRNKLIWISSNNGLFKVSLDEITAFIEGKQKSFPYYYRYSYNDGLSTNEFNGGCFPSAVAVNSSTWSFPSLKGLVWFQPDQMPLGDNRSAIFIDKILLNDLILSTNHSNSINTQTHRFKLSLFLSSPNWSDDNNLQFEYRIQEKAKKNDWILVKDNTSALEFQNLAGGRHTLFIRKRVGIGNRDYQEIKLTIEVPKLFYEYNWFWILSALVLLALIYLLNRISTYVINKKKEKLELLVDAKTVELREAIHLLEKQNTLISNSELELKKENELKSTLLFLLSHDIASPLRHINQFLNSSLQYKKSESLSLDDLADLKISTNHLENLLDNIVAWIKHTNQNKIQPQLIEFDLHPISVEKIGLFDLAIKKKGIRVFNHIQLKSFLVSDPFVCSMALQNLVGNAINYIQEGSIELDFIDTPTHYQIIVTDTGIGMSDEMIALIVANNNNYNNQDTHQSLGGYGIGIKITTQLLKLIDGELLFAHNKKSNGTIATISIKKSNLGF